MLSILIPTYNYNVLPLVKNLFEQCKKERIEYEIIVLDDTSSLHFDNEKINLLENCHFEILDKNIGRSAIRNLLAKKAKYDWLLFLDADAFPVENRFIYNYRKHINHSHQVLCGGMNYSSEKPSNNKQLRWTYGRKREALSALKRQRSEHLSFFSINFLLHKSIFDQVSFNEKLHFYGYEDVLFSYELQQQKIPIKHIDNPVYHMGIEENEVFLKKTELALESLHFLIKEQKFSPNYIKIARYLIIIQKTYTRKIFSVVFNLFKPIIKKQILSSNPNLFLFDVYRLGYICSLKS